VGWARLDRIVTIACLNLALLSVASTRAIAQTTPATQTQAPTSTSAPTQAKHGSFGPGVYLEDITYTLRLNSHRSLTLSQHDPNVAYMASFGGYVFKTTDGGRTWDESRLIVERRPFYGDGGQRLYFGVHRKGGSPKLGSGGDLIVKYKKGRQRIETEVLGYDRITGAGKKRAGAASNVNFGIGLPGRAPRLQTTVRRFGKPTAGLNIKQTLLQRGFLPTEVRFVVEHPKNPKILLACTMYGLFRSDDGGLNWVRTFQGINPKGRRIFHAAVDPNDGKKVFVATGYGVYVSTDGGDNFMKLTAQGVGNATTNWIMFNPFDSKYVFAGTNYGVLRSADGGDNWDWIYFTTFPAARVVRYIEIDPHDKTRGYIATHDGLFTIKNILKGGLEDWQRLGGLRFTAMETRKITVDPKQRGHMWALTTMKLPRLMSKGLKATGGNFIWESLDGGKNWRVIYSGETVGNLMWYENDRRDPSLLWIVWSRALSRMRRVKPGRTRFLSPTQARKVHAILAGDRLPPVQQVVMAALKFSGTELGLQLDFRRRSRIKALVPRLNVVFSNYAFDFFHTFHDGI
jgi:hypothetical protein